MLSNFSFSNITCHLFVAAVLFYIKMFGKFLKLILPPKQNKIHGLGYNSEVFPLTSDLWLHSDSIYLRLLAPPTTFYIKSEMVLLVLNDYLKDFHLSSKFQILIMSNGSKTSSNINLRAYFFNPFKGHQLRQSWISSCLICCDRAII